MNVTGITLLAVLFVPSFLQTLHAEGGRATCGTYPERIQEELLRSRLNRERRELEKVFRRFSGLAVLEEPRGASSDIGDIAVLEEDSGIISRRNLFNLNGRRLRFTPQPSGGYQLEVGTSDYNEEAALAGSPLINLGDDDTRRLELPFTVQFFNSSQKAIFLNSDGNLSFEEGDVATSDRSLGRLLSGVPRLAPFFADLDPTRGGSVRVLTEPGRFIVSWVEVPEYVSFGLGARNTFQVRLFANGTIEYAFRQINSEEAVVGIAPGRLGGAASIVRLETSTGQTFPAAIAERFTRREELDTVTAAQRFYETHEDAYDYLVFYNALGVTAGSGVVAFEVTVRNQRTGFGDLIVDVGANYGSPRRLQAILNMGPLSQYPTDPNEILPARFSSRDTPLSVLAHEAGHLFLAFASVRDPDNPNSLPMLGRQTAHWNFAFNSEASLLEGNRIEDRGTGVSPRFETVGVTEGFSALDQYLMGLRPKEEVPPTFYVRNATINSFFPPPPQIGVRFDGQRREVDVDQLIDEVGRRTPDHTVSQRKFRFGFVLIVPRGETADPALVAQLETYRREFESYYFRAAGQRATAEATLKKSVALSLWPASGVLTGRTAMATLRLEKPSPVAQSFGLRSRESRIQTPQIVTVAAGQREARFVVAGRQPGTDTLEVIPGDSSFEAAEAHVQVRSGFSDLSLQVVSGDGQVSTGIVLAEPIVLRVGDVNRLGYPGLRVTAESLGNGEVSPASAETDEDGIVRFSWRPGASPNNRMIARIEGGASAVITSLGRPTLLATTVGNAASFTAGLAPFGIHTIFGVNLSAGVTAAAPLPWPGRINGVEVLVNGRIQPLIYISEGQINFYLADAFAGASEVTIQVITPLGESDIVQVPYRAVQPGIFPGAILRRGEFLEVYATGLGAVERRGGFDQVVAPVAATINGAPAEVLFAGLAPGFVGLYQVNLRASSSGPQQVRLRVGGAESNEVSIP